MKADFDEKKGNHKPASSCVYPVTISGSFPESIVRPVIIIMHHGQFDKSDTL